MPHAAPVPNAPGGNLPAPSLATRDDLPVGATIIRSRNGMP